MSLAAVSKVNASAGASDAGAVSSSGVAEVPDVAEAAAVRGNAATSGVIRAAGDVAVVSAPLLAVKYNAVSSVKVFPMINDTMGKGDEFDVFS